MAMVLMDFNGPEGFRMVDVVDTERRVRDDPDPVPRPLRGPAPTTFKYAYPEFARRCRFIAASLRAFLEYRYGDAVRIRNAEDFAEAIERYVWEHSGVIRRSSERVALALL
jgi:hypothetical protein